MAAELLKKCVAARKGGYDFRTIYETIIHVDPLRAGTLTSATDGKRIWLDVRLSNGQSLVYDSREDQFRLHPEA